MDTSDILRLRIYNALGDFKICEEDIERVRRKQLIMYCGHDKIVSAMTLLMNNKITYVPKISKRIDKSIFIVKGIKIKYNHYNLYKYIGEYCEYCGHHKPTHMMRKSKSLWICVCLSCVDKMIHAANNLKIYYYTKNINLLLLRELFILDIANYITTMYIHDCIYSLSLNIKHY